VKIKHLVASGSIHEVVATFGQAQLIKKSDGRHELIGGTRNDHVNAIEWCSLFHHGLVFTQGKRANGQTSFAV
jgi:hypothetical protein